MPFIPDAAVFKAMLTPENIVPLPHMVVLPPVVIPPKPVETPESIKTPIDPVTEPVSPKKPKVDKPIQKPISYTDSGADEPGQHFLKPKDVQAAEARAAAEAAERRAAAESKAKVGHLEITGNVQVDYAMRGEQPVDASAFLKAPVPVGEVDKKPAKPKHGVVEAEKDKVNVDDDFLASMDALT